MKFAGAVVGSQTDYVYVNSGNLLGEYDPALNAVYGKEYFYLGSQQVASAQQNRLPVADAGADASYYSLQQVTLDGTASNDPDGGIVSFAWLQLAGTPVALSDTASATPIFTTPPATRRATWSRGSGSRRPGLR